jgi:hypothetical protein
MLKRSLSILLALIISSCGVFKKKSDDDQPAVNSQASNTESSGKSQSEVPETKKNSEETGNKDAKKVETVNITDQFKSSIQGKWITNCKAKDSGSKTTLFDINNLSFSFISTNFKNTSCSVGYFAIRYAGTLSVGAPAVAKSGGVNTSYKFSEIFMTLNDHSAVFAFNLSSKCGISNWALGVEKRISGTMPNCDLAADPEKTILTEVFNSVFVQTGSTLTIYSEDKADKLPEFILNKQ